MKSCLISWPGNKGKNSTVSPKRRRFLWRWCTPSGRKTPRPRTERRPKRSHAGNAKRDSSRSIGVNEGQTKYYDDMTMKYEITIDGARRSVDFTQKRNGASRVTFPVRGRVVEADAIRISRGAYSILLGGQSLEVTAEETSNGWLM